MMIAVISYESPLIYAHDLLQAPTSLCPPHVKLRGSQNPTGQGLSSVAGLPWSCR